MDPAILAEVGPTVQRMIDRGRIPGAVVMVARRGNVVFEHTAGFHRIEDEQPYQKDTIVRVYSMTKPVTSVAALMLVEEGQLDLADSIETWIPELAGLTVFEKGQPIEKWPRAGNIRVVDLLRHTAGFSYGNYGDAKLDQRYRDASLLARNSTLDEMVQKLVKLPLLAQPGQAWNYSVATDVVGLLVERVSGQTLDHFFRERLFEPLDMSDTGFFVPQEKADRFADNYLYGDQRCLVLHDAASQSRFHQAPSLFAGGAGLVSTAADFMRFCLMLAGGGELDGRRLLSESSVFQLTRNQLPDAMLPIELGGKRTGVGFGYGVSVVVGRVPLALFVPVGEYGWGGAASTHFWISPRDELAVIAMTQKMPFTFDLENRVKEIVYRSIS